MEGQETGPAPGRPRGASDIGAARRIKAAGPTGGRGLAREIGRGPRGGRPRDLSTRALRPALVVEGPPRAARRPPQLRPRSQLSHEARPTLGTRILWLLGRRGVDEKQKGFNARSVPSLIINSGIISGPALTPRGKKP